MFVFARRAIQARLDILSTKLLSRQVESLTARLNAPGADRIAAMWEVVLLAGMGQAARISNEVALPNGRRPDFSAFMDEGPEVVGDITTLSDVGLRELNPVDFLGAEIVRLARKHGLNPNHFNYRIDGVRFDGGGQPRTRLSLPDKSELASLIKNQLDGFVRNISRSGESAGDFRHDEGDSRFSVGYDTRQKYMQGSHGSFDGVTSLTRNVLANALKSKARQLRGADPASLRLIIVCDGGCSLMRRPYNHGTVGLLHSREVSMDFLRRNSSIDAVALVTVADRQPKAESLKSPHRSRWVELDLVLSPGSIDGRRAGATEGGLRKLLGEVINTIPEPISSPQYVSRNCDFENSTAWLGGGWGVSSNQVRISTRALSQLLAGTLAHSDFMELHGWDNDDPSSFSNIFYCLLREGRRLTEARVDLDAEPDDDWITFTFDGFDAANAPFTVSHQSAPISE